MQRRVFVSHSALFYPLLSSLSLSTLFLCRDKKKKKKRKSWERRLRGDYENKTGGEKSGEGVHLSAVVIKACALKRGQSIQLSASTSHQASWRRLKMSRRVQAASSALLRERERASNRRLRSGVGNNCSRGHKSRPSWKSELQSTWKMSRRPLRGKCYPLQREAELSSVRDVRVNTQVDKQQPRILPSTLVDSQKSSNHISVVAK